MTIKIPYSMKKLVFDKNTINSFFVDEDGRRQIRNGQVRALKEILEDGQHFSSPMVVNKIQKMKVLDGNHRYEAMKEVIDEDPNFSISVWVAVYDNLNKEQEIEVFRQWNLGVKQNATDFLKANWDFIPMGNRILNELPLRIYADNNHLAVKAFVGNQLMAKKHSEKFAGGYSGGIYDVIGDFTSLTTQDIDTLVDFSKFLEKTLGKYDKKTNPNFFGTTAIASIYQLWYDNKHVLSETKMVNAMKKILIIADNDLFTLSKGGGRKATQIFYDALIGRLNRRSGVKFLDYKQRFKERVKEQEAKQKMNQIVNLVQR